MCPQKWTYPTLHTSPSTHYSKLFNQCHGQYNSFKNLTYFQENKCLLGLYFLIVLTLFIGVIIFGILVYKGDLFDSLQSPLYKSLAMYEDNPAGPEAVKIKKDAFKQIWNTVQKDASIKYNFQMMLKMISI